MFFVSKITSHWNTCIEYEDFDSSLHAGPMTAFYSGFRVFVTSLRFILNLWHVWLSCGALQIIFAKFCIWGAFTWFSNLWSICMKKMSTQRVEGVAWLQSVSRSGYTISRCEASGLGSAQQKPKPSQCWKMMKVMNPFVRLSSKCSWIVIRAVALQTLQRQDRRHGIQRHFMN